jgi:hypothetical protein
MPERYTAREQYIALAQGSEVATQHITSGTRLLLGVQRAFEKIGREIPQGGALITLGCGEEPYAPAFKFFKPTEVIGADINTTDIGLANTHWGNRSDMFPARFVVADATEPDNVLAQAQPAAPIKNVMLLQPIVDNDPGSAVDEMYRTMVKNWTTRLDPTGYLTIATYTPEELMVFLQDADIQAHLVAYGTTDATDSSDMSGNQYIAILQRDSTTTKPVRLRNFDHYVENEFTDDPSYNAVDRTEGLRYTRQEAQDMEDNDWSGHWEDMPAKLPKGSRRKTK